MRGTSLVTPALCVGVATTTGTKAGVGTEGATVAVSSASVGSGTGKALSSKR